MDASISALFRLVMNYPPTAVGGIPTIKPEWDRRQLNDPPTAVGGILDFRAKPVQALACTLTDNLNQLFFVLRLEKRVHCARRKL